LYTCFALNLLHKITGYKSYFSATSYQLTKLHVRHAVWVHGMKYLTANEAKLLKIT
jgi:hypothetical protein